MKIAFSMYVAAMAGWLLVGCGEGAEEERKARRLKYSEQDRLEFSLSDGTRCVHLWGKLACGAPPKQ